jgi:hypothetical protein
MKITRRQLRVLIKEAILNERMACPPGKVYYNYGGNVEGCEDEDIVGKDKGQKDPHEQEHYSDCIVQLKNAGRKPTQAAIKQCIDKKSKDKKQ